MNKANSYKLNYPIFLVEKQGRKHAKFEIVRSKMGFSTVFRVPTKHQYIDGYVFDSYGHIYSYQGECGWPRFDGWLKILLELLIIPSILTKLLEFEVYFGPRLISKNLLSLEEFQKQILEKLSVYETEKDLSNLKERMKGEGEYSEIVEAIDWYIWNEGGSDDYQ